MSRIGRKEIIIPSGVTVDISKGNAITIKGPKGTLSMTIHPRIKVEKDGSTIKVTRSTDEKLDKSLHGLSRTLINNMVIGVTQGYEKKLEIAGSGYRASMNGKNLVLNVGYSHPITIVPEENISFETPTATSIAVRGIDKQRVGQIAAEIRSNRPPEPYHGKGIKYEGERYAAKPVRLVKKGAERNGHI